MATTTPTLQAARDSFAAQRLLFDRVMMIVQRSDETSIDHPTPQAMYGAVHLTKAYLHGVALGKVLPAVPGPTAQTHDLASAAILVRAIAETYLAFRYCCAEPQLADDIRFRDALMGYHDAFKRHAILSVWSADAARVAQSAAHLKQRGTRLRALPLFIAQNKDVRNKQLKGKDAFHRPLTSIAEDAGITRGVWDSAWIFLSQFQHAAPLAMLDLYHCSADEPQLPANLSFVTDLASCFLARLTLEVSDLHNQRKPTFSADDVQLLSERKDRLARAQPSEVPVPVGGE